MKIYLNSENFPDANFRKALAWILGISEGDEITEKMIAATTSLEVTYREIADLTGIEHFTSLTKLNCDYNQLTSLDMSNNTALKWLDCDGNQLRELDVSQNTAIEWLHCSDNQLTALDVSKNTALTELYYENNQLTSLDVSQNTALEELWCSNNQLTELDVTENPCLRRVSVNDNVEVYSSPNLQKELDIRYQWVVI